MTEILLNYAGGKRTHRFLPSKGSGGSSSAATVSLPSNNSQGVRPRGASGNWILPGRGAMVGFQGAFDDKCATSVEVSGLNSCAGLIVAARHPSEPRFTEFIAFHFGGSDGAWGASFAGCARWINAWWHRFDVTLYAACAAGLYHYQFKTPKAFADGFQKKLSTVARMKQLAVFWPDDGKQSGNHDGEGFSAKPGTGGYVALGVNGLAKAGKR